MNTRIKDDIVNLDDEKVKEFFNNRVKKTFPYILNYANYQDAHPELAVERDEYEKKKIVPLLPEMVDAQILDIGCGVGRWGQYFDKTLSGKGCYIGVDYSEGLIGLADKYFENSDRCFFIQSRFQDIRKDIFKGHIEEGFDLIIINGVLMYINDADVGACLKIADSLLKKGGTLYIKESVGYEYRLTLDRFYSEEMASEYSAIYRSIGEYRELVETLLGNYIEVDQGEMWKRELGNRSETTAYYWILKK